MKLPLFLLLSLLPGVAPGQFLKGTITDQRSGDALPGVVVENRSRQRTVVTDDAGRFSVPGSPGDTLQISYIGYYPLWVLVRHAETEQGIHIRLSRQVIVIDTVQVRPELTPYQKDSLRNRELFGKKVEERPPRFGFSRPHAVYGGMGSINAPLSSWMGRKKKKRLKAFQEHFKKDEVMRYVLSRYDPRLVQELTGFTGDTLTHFMNAYPMAPGFARAATDMEVRMWIRYNYREWTGSKRKYAPASDTLK